MRRDWPHHPQAKHAPTTCCSIIKTMSKNGRVREDVQDCSVGQMHCTHCDRGEWYRIACRGGDRHEALPRLPAWTANDDSVCCWGLCHLYTGLGNCGSWYAGGVAARLALGRGSSTSIFVPLCGANTEQWLFRTRRSCISIKRTVSMTSSEIEVARTVQLSRILVLKKRTTQSRKSPYISAYVSLRTCDIPGYTMVSTHVAVTCSVLGGLRSINTKYVVYVFV